MTPNDPVNKLDWTNLVRDTWNGRAADWNEAAERNRLTPDRVIDLQRTMNALAIEPGSRLLDAGCGSGQYALAFAALGVDVTGIDLSPVMISLAQQHAAEESLPVQFRVGRIDRIEVPRHSFDAIHARVVLQFTESVPATLREFRRILRPGGRLFTSVPSSLSPIYGRSWQRHLEPTQPTGVNYLVPWELETLLTKLGWQIHDGWGEYGANSSGDSNPLQSSQLQALPVRLQQAAATTWTIISS